MAGRSNWGRWGSDDERGALNLLTPERVRRAAALVRQGKVVSLAQPIDNNAPILAGRPRPQHVMHVSGADYVAGAVQPAGRGIADDGLIISPHGTVTHIDALCHFWAGEQLYNGHPQSTVRGYGARRCGVEKLGPVVGRGILLDVPRCTGRGRLEPDERIGVADLQRCMREQDLEVEAGDIVLVRTGWATVYEDDPGLYAQAQPGLSPEAAEWLADRDVALVGADNAAVGPLAGGTGLHVPLEDDIHLLFLWHRGVPLLEMLQLEELSRCRPGPFLFVTVPLPIRGGTGSPVNPVAIL